MSVFFLCLYIVLTITQPMAWWDPVLGLNLVNPVAIAAIFFSLPLFLAQWQFMLAQHPEIRALLAYLVAATLSLLPLWWFGGMLGTFQEIGKLVILYLLIVLHARNRRSYRIILWTLISCNIWLAVHGMLQFHTGTGFGPATGFWRFTNKETGAGVHQIVAYGYMEDPNDLCLMFIVSIPLVWSEIRSVPNPLLKGIGWGLISMFAYAATLTNSRGGYVGLLGTAATYLLISTRGVKRVLLLSLGIGVLMIVAPARMGSISGGDASRAVNWGEGLATFKQHPIFGIGFRMYGDYTSSHQVAHNTFIHVLTECGLLGYVPFMSLLYFTFIHLWRRVQSSAQHSYERDSLLGLFAGGSGYLLSCYFLSRQYTPPLYILLALAHAGALVAARANQTPPEPVSQVRRDRRKAVLFSLSSVVVLWISVRLANRISGL